MVLLLHAMDVIGVDSMRSNHDSILTWRVSTWCVGHVNATLVAEQGNLMSFIVDCLHHMVTTMAQKCLYRKYGTDILRLL